MEHIPNNSSDPIRQDPTPRERERLVRYCARFTRDPHAAEDLAQQTLLEAWRCERSLRDPQARQGWLFGIARNLCLMWARGRTREVSQLTSLDEGGWDRMELNGHLADEFDLEVELEREDLARLLDRALALLPPATRRVLAERYIEESPQAEVAERLGLTEGAVEARLHRGRLALRRILTTDLTDEAAAHGLVSLSDAGWRETRIWCPSCGARRLLGKLSPTELTLRCPDCCSPLCVNTVHVTSPELFGDVRSFRPAFSRVLARMDESYRAALEEGGARCWGCDRLLPWRPGTMVSEDAWGGAAAHAVCVDCRWYLNQDPYNRASALPEMLRFWRAHPRMRELPGYEVEAEGEPAIVARYESVADGARFEVVLARDRLRPIGVHGAPPEKG